LLFTDAPEALQDKIEQVIRLIRSKGIGVFFVSQNPLDVPDIVLGQLGNRVQHALRAYTPRDQKAVRSAAQTFRTNPNVDVETAITELSVGEALTSFLDEDGAPGIVERAFVIPPRSLIGTITGAQRSAIIQGSPLHGKYEQPIDRASAYEMLKQKADEIAAAEAAAEAEQRRAEAEESWRKAAEKEARRTRSSSRSSRARQSSPENILEDVAETAARSFGSQIGRSLVRGLLGSLTGKKSRW
jgi:DNA helicase HerA-like ATPase